MHVRDEDASRSQGGNTSACTFCRLRSHRDNTSALEHRHWSEVGLESRSRRGSTSACSSLDGVQCENNDNKWTGSRLTIKAVSPK